MARPAFCGAACFSVGRGKHPWSGGSKMGNTIVWIYICIFIWDLNGSAGPQMGRRAGREQEGGLPAVGRRCQLLTLHLPAGPLNTLEGEVKSFFLPALGLGHLGLILVKIGPYVGILQKVVSTWFRDPQKSQNWPQPCVGHLQNQKQKRK